MLNPLEVKNNFSLKRDIPSLLLKKTSGCNEHPKVCVCIPTYKRVETLMKTIESCQNQLGFNDYIIIVSDNNPERNDETEEFFSHYEGTRIKYYKNQESLGMYGNINRCFELSEADYTVIVHDDDLLFPHYLQIVYGTMQRFNHIDILYPNHVSWKSSFEQCPEEKLDSETYIYKNSITDCVLWNPHPPTGVMFKTKSVFAIGGFDAEYYPSADYYFNCKAFELLNVYTMHQQLYVYRWEINTSLKLETLLGFVSKDIPLKEYIIEKHSWLHFFKKQILTIHSQDIHNLLKSVPIDQQERFDSIKFEYSENDLKRARLFKKYYALIKGIGHFFKRKRIEIKN